MAAFVCALLLPAAAQNAGLGNLPLYFEANRGQSEAAVRYIARTRDGVFRLSAAEARITLAKAPALTGSKKNLDRARWNHLTTSSLRLRFLGANSAARISGAEPLPGKVNYLLGANPSAWQKQVPTFTRVLVDNLYPGIQLVYYGNERQLEYDFVVAPGVDPGVIAFQVTGADQLEVDAQGDLLLKVGSEVLRQQKPVLYQLSNGQRTPIAGGYRLRNATTVVFEIGPFDQSLPLVIDPVLTYSSYLGGQGSDTGRAVALDSAGNIYVTGDTLSGQLATTNVFEPAYRSGYPKAGGDAFVAKFDSTGTNLLFLTYLGGSGDDVAVAIALDSAGNSYVTGVTDSTNFPTLLAISNTIAGQGRFGLDYHPYDAFAAKLDTTGNLVYSTYLGGSDRDEGLGIAVDPNTSIAYVTGFTQSTNFPTFQPLQAKRAGLGNAFVSALTLGSNGLSFVYSTYLGGTSVDHGEDIAVDALGQAYITGFTTSTNFPVTTNAFQPFQSNRGKSSDAFVSVLATNGASLVASTFLGGVGADIGYRLTLDGAGSVYVTGSQAGLGFPITPGNLNPGGVFTSSDGAATWTAANAGLCHNQVYGIALDTNSSPPKLYAVTGRGITLSPNGGATWATSLNTLTQLVSIVIDPTTPSTLYAGGIGVFKSTDAGTTWVTNNSGLTKQPINKLLLDPQVPATLYAATEGAGVFKSVNGAATWEQSSNGLNSRVRDLAFDPSNPSILYAATPEGVYRTLDGGGRWQLFRAGLTNKLTRAVAVDPLTPTTVYVGTQHGNVFKSLDAGTNWFPVNTGLSSSNSVTALAIDPLTPSTLYAGTTNGLYKSLNAGTNWSLATNGLAFADIATLVVNPASPSSLYAGLFGKDAFGALDAFVTKLTPDLRSVVYSVALGGNAVDQGWDVAVDGLGDAFVVGTTYSTNFPTAQTMGLLSSTNAGGTNFFTFTKRPGPTTSDVFVTAINPDASAFLYSTYLGGGSNDFGMSIALDSAGNAILLGQTFSPGFPVVGARQSALYGFSDAFLAKIQLSNAPVTVLFTTVPEGLLLVVDGVTNVAPFTTTVLQGSFHSVAALPVQTDTNGVPYAWSAWSDGGGLSHTLIINGDSTLTATFTTNLPPASISPSKGTFTGLFFNTNAGALAIASSGSFSAKVNAPGSFSAKFRLLPRTFSLSGRFSTTGFFSNSIPRRGPFRALSVTLQLDPSANTLTGRLTDGEWTAELLAFRSVFSGANPAPQGGNKYTLLLPGGADSIGQPGGDSFATLNVTKSGSLRFAGTLADGTRVSQSTFVSEGGEWPLFIPLYKQNRSGLLLGWLNFTNAPDTDIAGFVDWFKLSQAATNAYPGGFLIQSEPVGSLYAFTNGVPVLSLGAETGALVLENGGLPQSLTNPVSLSSANRFSSPGPLSLTLSPSSGLLKGSLRDPAVTRKTIPLNGVVLQKQGIGAGYFSFTNQIGRVLLLP